MKDSLKGARLFFLCCVAGALAALWIPVSALFLVLRDGCRNQVMSVAVSPNGKIKAVAFQRDCGATTGFSTQISVLPVSEVLPDKGGDVFVADLGSSEARPSSFGGPEVFLSWSSDDILEVTHDPRIRVFKARVSHRSVSIRYRMVIPETANQAPEPTVTAVTSPAAQESRQPWPRLILDVMQRMKAPAKIGDFSVLCYSRMDDRHRSTGRTRHYVGGKLETAMAGLAICRYPNDADFYLLYCDGGWRPMTDTCHSTLEQAKRQAEFEFEGVSNTWIAVGADEKPNQTPEPTVTAVTPHAAHESRQP